MVRSDCELKNGFPQHKNGILWHNKNCEGLNDGDSIYPGLSKPPVDDMPYETNSLAFNGAQGCKAIVLSIKNKYQVFVRDTDSHAMKDLGTGSRHLGGKASVEVSTGSGTLTVTDASQILGNNDKKKKGSPPLPDQKPLLFLQYFSRRPRWNPKIKLSPGNNATPLPIYTLWISNSTQCQYGKEDSGPLQGLLHWECTFQCNITLGEPLQGPVPTKPTKSGFPLNYAENRTSAVSSYIAVAATATPGYVFDAAITAAASKPHHT